jgi:carbon monoxide dehydrogenase subunit G
MKITSQQAQINASAEQVFQFLSDCNNIYHLLPQDKISDWKATENDCSFKVQKMATIPLVFVRREPNTLLEMKSGEGAPFPFTLNIVIDEDGASSRGHIEFDGQVNAFLKMMVEKPLSNLFDYMSHKLKTHFEA